MKRTLFLLCAAAGLIVITACAKKKETPDKNADNGKILVTYFSATGTTRGVAEQIAETFGADIKEIKPETPYTDADLNWRDEQSRSSVEMRDKSSRPAIAEKIDNIADYDVVFVGFPIWWYTAPTIINTFIESHDLKGKTLIPFATSGGSTIEKSCADLKNSYPELDWKEGKLLNSTPKSDIESWKKELGL